MDQGAPDVGRHGAHATPRREALHRLDTVHVLLIPALRIVGLEHELGG